MPDPKPAREGRIRPQDVPSDLVDAAWPVCESEGIPWHDEAVRMILAAVLPEARRAWFTELMGADAVAARQADAATRTPDDTVRLCEMARPGEHAGRTLRDAAKVLLSDGWHEDRCSYGPPGTCDCALGIHYRWLIKRSEEVR